MLHILRHVLARSCTFPDSPSEGLIGFLEKKPAGGGRQPGVRRDRSSIPAATRVNLQRVGEPFPNASMVFPDNSLVELEGLLEKKLGSAGQAPHSHGRRSTIAAAGCSAFRSRSPIRPIYGFGRCVEARGNS